MLLYIFGVFCMLQQQGLNKLITFQVTRVIILTCVINTSYIITTHDWSQQEFSPLTDGWCGCCLHGLSGQPNYSSMNWPEKKGHCETVISQKWPLVVVTSSSGYPSIVSRCRKESWPPQTFCSPFATLMFKVIKSFPNLVPKLQKKSLLVSNWGTETEPGYSVNYFSTESFKV